MKKNRRQRKAAQAQNYHRANYYAAYHYLRLATRVLRTGELTNWRKS